MIQQETILQVADNSGAKTVKCIKVLGGYKKKYARLGDLIVVSVKKLRNKTRLTSKVKKGEIYKALIIRTKARTKRKDGSSFFFKKNYVSLINKQGNPIATRIIGSVSRRLKKKFFMKFISISAGIV